VLVSSRTTTTHPDDRRSAALVVRVVFLLTLVFAGVGGSAIGTGPVAAAGTAIGTERAGHERIRVGPHQVSALTETSPHRTGESRADALDGAGATRTAPVDAVWTRRGAPTPHVPSRVARRAPERGPPVLPPTA
jgi:hypothetical protein